MAGARRAPAPAGRCGSCPGIFPDGLLHARDDFEQVLLALLGKFLGSPLNVPPSLVQRIKDGSLRPLVEFGHVAVFLFRHGSDCLSPAVNAVEKLRWLAS